MTTPTSQPTATLGGLCSQSPVGGQRRFFIGQSPGEAVRDELSSRSSSHPVVILERLCSQRDEERRKKTGVGRIPCVKWEDVGGLSHVRREIMNAIELPLQYPHLFPASTSSGILLYGPPGTGKTLVVSKEICVECAVDTRFCSLSLSFLALNHSC